MYIPTVIPSRWINQWSDIPSCRAFLIPLQGNHMIVHQHIGSGVPEVGGQGFTCAEAIWSGARTLLRSQGAYLWPWGLCRAIQLRLEVTGWLLCRVVEENDRFACLKVSWEQLPVCLGIRSHLQSTYIRLSVHISSISTSCHDDWSVIRHQLS